MNPTIILGIRLKFFNIVLKKKNTAATIAPLCIATVKTLKKSEEAILRIFPDIKIWAVEETGANSVNPSTIPKIIDFKSVKSIVDYKPRQ